jgi:putative thiamine transport system substrate-binding protein
MNKYIFLAVVCVIAAAGGVFYALKQPSDDVANNVADKTVHFNAWGGSPAVNDYIAWAGRRLKEDHDINLVHVKLTDTGEAVGRILAEKAAGRNTDGSVDLIWVNGENFASLKKNSLLRDDAWAFDLSSWKYTDADSLPALVMDFGNPTDGLESPWGRAQLVFAYDKALMDSPPKSAQELQQWIKANPGRFTYPQIPDFTGTAFLKQIMIELAEDPSVFAQNASEADTDAALAPLWAWLDDVTPHLWQQGKNYPKNYTDLSQRLGDGEVQIAFAYNPSKFSNDIKEGVLPNTIRSYIHDGGTISNVHYVAIPFNASAAEAAMITADFLLSPEAQIRKANPDIWGDPTVLAIAKLDAKDQEAFSNLPRGIATLSPEELGATLAEPHPTWIEVIERGWQERYLSGN